MSWYDNMLSKAQAQIGGFFMEANPYSAAKDFLEEAVAQKMRDAAYLKAHAILAKTHASVMHTILWQNALLLASLLPVYLIHAAYPFYVAYAIVSGYTIYKTVQSWPVISKLLSTRSITATLSHEVYLAIQNELTQREYYERIAVEWLGPDLKKISDNIAQKLKPDVVAAATNMAITLVLAFIAFRVFIIPLLERRVLL